MYDWSRYIASFKRKHMPLGPKMKQSDWKNKRNAKFHPEQQFQGDAWNEQ